MKPIEFKTAKGNISIDADKILTFKSDPDSTAEAPVTFIGTINNDEFTVLESEDDVRVKLTTLAALAGDSCQQLWEQHAYYLGRIHQIVLERVSWGVPVDQPHTPENATFSDADGGMRNLLRAFRQMQHTADYARRHELRIANARMES